jgi:hypothetical protein
MKVHYVQIIKLSKALAVTLLILQASLPLVLALEATQNQTFFYWHLLRKLMCHSVTKGRRFWCVEAGSSICTHKI